MSRKIAILGTAEPHWRDAPFADESWEIWTCGGNYASAPRITRHFEIHKLTDTCKGWGVPEQEAAARNAYVEWMRSQGSLVWMNPSPDLPDATPYPLDMVLERFPDGYFTNSISYMIALALVEGCTELGIWGVDMALSSGVRERDEYGNQRPSCEFYLGVAVGMGVRVTLPPQTTLLKTRRLYGFTDADDGFGAIAQAKIDELTQRKEMFRREKIKARNHQLEAERHEAAMTAAMDVAEYFKRNMEH